MASSGRCPSLPFLHGNRTPARRGGLRRLLLGPVVPTAPVPSSYRTHTTLLPGPGAAAPRSVPTLRACAAITAVVRHRTRRDTCRAPAHSIPLRRGPAHPHLPGRRRGHRAGRQSQQRRRPRPPVHRCTESRADPVASNKRVSREAADIGAAHDTDGDAVEGLGEVVVHPLPECGKAVYRLALPDRSGSGRRDDGVRGEAEEEAEQDAPGGGLSPVRRATASSSMTT